MTPSAPAPLRQTIVRGIPPNYLAILERFPTARLTGTIFSYGAIIYNPSNAQIPPPLIEHEAVHGERQIAMGVDAWWERYLKDPLFVLNEEIYAHHAEYKAVMRRRGPRPSDIRTIAGRLSGPLYGNLLTMAQAKHAIMTGQVA